MASAERRVRKKSPIRASGYHGTPKRLERELGGGSRRGQPLASDGRARPYLSTVPTMTVTPPVAKLGMSERVACPSGEDSVFFIAASLAK